MNILVDAVAGFAALGAVTVLVMLVVGVVLGVIVGIIPGIGGVIALTLALPFTFDMDPLAALVLMVALSAVVATSDTIPAVLFGVPGTVGCAATLLDGYPKGAAETFGKGDVRGVIASESSNNAKHGGALIPTIAFGVPGSPVMALLIGAFLIFGIVPGPSMLGSNLDITMSLVWTIVLANILAATICWSGANQLGRIATVRPGLLVPLVMAAVYLVALQASNRWGDLVVLVAAGVMGWVMKQFGWPRPPLILGFVLGALIERYLFISVGRWGWEWLTHPIVLVLLALSVWTFLGPSLVRLARGRESREARGRLDVAGRIGTPAVWFALLFAAFFVAVLASAPGMAWQAALAPVVVGIVGLIAAGIAVLNELRRRTSPHALGAGVAVATPADMDADYGDMARREVWRRGAVYALWTGGFVALAMTIGVLPALVVHTLLYLRLGWGETWRVSAIITASVVAVVWVVFQEILYTPWPTAFIGDVFPALRDQFRLF